MVTGVAKLHDTTFRHALSGDDEEVLSRPMLVSPSDKLPGGQRRACAAVRSAVGRQAGSRPIHCRQRNPIHFSPITV